MYIVDNLKYQPNTPKAINCAIIYVKKYTLIWNAKNKKEIDDFKQKKQTDMWMFQKTQLSWRLAYPNPPPDTLALDKTASGRE